MKQVAILALVILLAATITSAKKVSKLVSDETTSKPEPECRPEGASGCLQDSDCCTDNCEGEWFMGAWWGTCAPPEPCRTNLKECRQDTQCCSGHCKKFLLNSYCVGQAGSI